MSSVLMIIAFEFLRSQLVLLENILSNVVLNIFAFRVRVPVGEFEPDFHSDQELTPALIIDTDPSDVLRVRDAAGYKIDDDFLPDLVHLVNRLRARCTLGNDHKFKFGAFRVYLIFPHRFDVLLENAET